MAKFIIEVDDDYIRENANLDVTKKKVDESSDKGGFAKAIFDMIAYSNIVKKLDKGETEFKITRDMMDDDTKREYFDRNAADVLMLAVMAEPNKKED